MSYRHESRSSLIRGDSDPYVQLQYEGGYHSREGLTPPPVSGPRTRKMYWPNTTWTWAFIITVVLEACIVLAIESYLFAEFQMSLVDGIPSTALSKSIPTYLALFIFGFIYEIALAYDALRLKNTIQVIGLCMYNAGLLIYSSIQVDQINKAIQQLEAPLVGPPQVVNTQIWPTIQPYLIAAPCIIAFFTCAMSAIAWKLYDEFAWTIYKHISADLRMKRRYLTFQVYITLLKFDFFFFLGFTIQFLIIVTHLQTYEKVLTAVAIPITILVLGLAAFWTRRESKSGVLVTIFFYFVALAYFIFKLARMYQASHAPFYLPARKSLTSFAVITIVLLIMTIINACVCMSNFGQGLKPHIMKRRIGGEEAAEKDHMTELPDLKHGPVSSRMTID